MKCPHCGADINESEIAKHFGGIGGRAKSPLKKLASQINGKLGGRPKKKTN